MVDIVAQKMPSESDVHVARSFLTKILRSSMRRNEPVSRPHSWHATKFNESQSEISKTQSPPPPVWQTRYDASSSSTDLSSGWDQTNLRRVSDQFSSLGSMDSLEHVPHPYPSGRLSPAKSNNSVEHLGGGKRDSAYSSFSTSSGTPDYTLSRSNAASTENMLYKVTQWDSGGRHSNSRHSQNLSEGGVKPEDRPGYLQLPGGGAGQENPRTEEQALGSRHSSSGRANSGPVWHVPEKKKAASPSPPPPLPPVRSDSFAATKSHEKGLIIAYPEGPDAHVYPKGHGKGSDKGIEAFDNSHRNNSSRHNPHTKTDVVNPYISTDNFDRNQLNSNSNKLYSLSTTDIRAGQPPYPYHQRQYSDESTFYSQSRSTVSVAKPQTMSSYYSSMQELPTNNVSQMYNNQSQGRTASVSLSSTAIDQNPEGGGHTRYYCVTARQPGQPSSQALAGKPEDRRVGMGVEVVPGGGNRMSLSPQTVNNKAKYPPPQLQQLPPYPGNSKDSNGYSKLDDGSQQCHKQPAMPHLPIPIPAIAGSEAPTARLSGDPRGSQRRHTTQNSETHYMSYPPSKQAEQRRSLPAPQREVLQDGRSSQGRANICPQATPMLHSLSKETSGQGDGPRDTAAGIGEDGSQEVLEPGKIARRSDRFATTLRNEIQMKKAKLQKSKSAAALGGKCEDEQEVCRPQEDSVSLPSDGSFTSTYKDHLKEAQARVLKATSFRRRDLEPILLEHPGAEAVPGYPAPALPWKDAALLPSVSEAPPGKCGSMGSQVTRIGGRKRFPPEKKTRSFSEPDKIHEVGVDEDLAALESAGTLVDRRKIFETTGKPAFPKPLSKQALQQSGSSEECKNTKARAATLPSMEAENNLREVRIRALPPVEYTEENQSQEVFYSAHRQAILEQQRLGTFAEYEATWNIQKKPPEARASGRSHSADNILDPGVEERTKPACVHERSRSSPSADFYGQNILVQGRKSAEYSQVERLPAEQDNTTTRFSGRDCGAHEKPGELEHFPEPPPQLMTAESPEHRHPAAGPLPAYHRPTSISRNPSDSALPGPADHPYSEPPAGPRRTAPTPQRPPPPRLPDKPRRPEITPPLGSSQESLPSSQGRAPTARSPSREVKPAPVPALPLKSLPEQGKGLAEKEQGGVVHPTESSNPQPTPPGRPSPCGPSALTEPTMDDQRSPSPQFAPQRLTDKPPVSLRDENSNRMDNVTETNNNPAVKKVPIKIVHAESLTEKESRQYLLHSDAVSGPQGPAGLSHVSSLGAPDQSYSLFCAYSRQREPGPPAETDPELSEAEPDPRPPQTGSPLREHGASTQPSGPPSSNGVAGPPHSQEEQKREELARDIMDKDKSLADILDQSKMRTTMDLMEGIFPQGEQLLEGAHQRRKVAPKQSSPKATEDRIEEESAAVPLVTSSTYYSTSAPKAELLIKMKDMQEQSEEHDSEDELLENDHQLANKKQELMDSLSRKLQVLREARQSVQEDVADNNALGEEVEATVQQVCKPNELEKFRMFVGDLDKVVSLLLSLSGRLARVENALNSLEHDAPPEERRTLTEKRKLLIRQHEDAKELKENLDRRERVVLDILASYLSEESLADYRHFVKMKSALIIEQRKLEDKIKLGDEQLKCLTDSLPLEQRMPL